MDDQGGSADSEEVVRSQEGAKGGEGDEDDGSSNSGSEAHDSPDGDAHIEEGAT